jgi:hypothetical protein
MKILAALPIFSAGFDIEDRPELKFPSGCTKNKFPKITSGEVSSTNFMTVVDKKEIILDFRVYILVDFCSIFSKKNGMAQKVYQ